MLLHVRAARAGGVRGAERALHPSLARAPVAGRPAPAGALQRAHRFLRPRADQARYIHNSAFGHASDPRTCVLRRGGSGGSECRETSVLGIRPPQVADAPGGRLAVITYPNAQCSCSANRIILRSPFVLYKDRILITNNYYLKQ